MKHLILFESFLETPESDDYGKKIVYKDDNDYMISVDSLEDVGYLVLWHKGKNVGFMSLQPFSFKKDRYRRVYNVEIKKGHKGQGYGMKLYRAALKHLGSEYKGILSYLPERVNKKEVPRIYGRLNGYVVDSDYAIIPTINK